MSFELIENRLNRIYLFLCSTATIYASLPWDQMTHWGYFGEIAFSLGIVVASLVSNNMLLVLFVSICFYHRAFCEIYEHLIEKFKWQSNQEKSDEKLIYSLIGFHVLVKE